MIPVPFEIQQRAHDAAFMLTTEFRDRLPLEQRIALTVILRSEPLSWREVAYALAAWSAVVAVRV